MGSLCSKQDRNEHELPLLPARVVSVSPPVQVVSIPPPVRVVTVADVAARTALLLERRAAAQRGAEAATFPTSTTSEVAPVGPPLAVERGSPAQSPTRQTLRLSRLEADAISNALKTGNADFINVSKTLEPLDLILDRQPGDLGICPRTTDRRSDGEGSQSPTFLWTGTDVRVKPENGKSSEAGLGTLDSGSSSPPRSSMPELDRQATLPCVSRTHVKSDELQGASNYEQVTSVSCSPLQEVPNEKTCRGTSPSRNTGDKQPHIDTPACKAPDSREIRTIPTTDSENVVPAGADSRPVRRYVPSSRVLSGHRDSVFSVCFSADGNCLISGSADKTIRIWDLSASRIQNTIELHLDTVRSVAVSMDNTTLASASLDGTVRLWDLAAATTPTKTFLARAKIMSVAFSLNGRYLASGAQDNLVRVWDVKTGDLTLELPGHDDAVASVAVSPDGRYLASGSLDMTIRIWDLKGGLVDTLVDHVGCVHTVAFSPCSSRLASGSSDRTVVLWDTTPGLHIKKLRCLRGHTDFVWSVAFTRDGDRVASGSADKTIVIWKVATGQHLYVLHGHEDAVFSLAFSPFSDCFVSASRDKMLRIWNVREDP